MQNRNELADIIFNDVDNRRDSLIFFLIDGNGVQDSINPGARHIVALDSSNRQEVDAGKFVFGLVTHYGRGKTRGAPRYTEMITEDKFRPTLFSPSFKPMARELEIRWLRPTDPTSFFDPAADTGIIAGYDIRISVGERTNSARFGGLNSLRTAYWVAGTERSEEITESGVLTDPVSGKVLRKTLTLPDGGRSHLYRGEPESDSIKVSLSGLNPLDTLDIRVFARDSNGNTNEGAMQTVRVILTDTTQPSIPGLRVVDTTISQNGFVIEWEASRDSVPGPDGALRPADNPNANILEYRLQRIAAHETLEKLYPVGPENRNASVFTDTMSFLPPGTTYSLRLHAVDSSGHESPMAIIEVTTDSVRFTGADSAATCPEGLVRIPGGFFRLGSDQSGHPADERPERRKYIESYCMEPYEHRRDGKFVTNVTWEEANRICNELGAEHGDADNSRLQFQLCTEAQWERACKGGDTANPHIYGIQSEQSASPTVLQRSCNQGTNDVAMADSLSLRNRVCLTGEGVYDMAGNFSEWVLDPYRADAYFNLPDTLRHGTVPPQSTENAVLRGFRGGNYIRPNIPIGAIQDLARCTNRDFPKQVRPRFKDVCVGDGPKVVVIYGSGLNEHSCFPVPSLPQGREIGSLSPNMRDTSNTTFLVFYKGGSEFEAFPIVLSGADTVFRKRLPVQVNLTTRSLMVVNFVNAAESRTITDTLDAGEAKDPASLKTVLERESSPPWEAEKNPDGNYAVEYLYGYSVLGTKNALEFYSHHAIGFRCCSLPIRPAAE